MLAIDIIFFLYLISFKSHFKVILLYMYLDIVKTVFLDENKYMYSNYTIDFQGNTIFK